MRKGQKLGNLALYLVFATNTVYCISHGFTWPYWVAAALTACVLALDIRKVVKQRGRS